MTVKELKEFLETIPDDYEMRYNDSEMGEFYTLDKEDFSIHEDVKWVVI